MSSMRTKVALYAMTAVLLGGCQGVVWGNVIVLAITVTLFLGTLQLGRREGSSSGSRASSDHHDRATRSVL